MYFKENISVSILFLVMNAFIVLIGLLDRGIPNVSIIYMILFNLLVFIIYLAADYIRKKQFQNDFDALTSLNEVEAIDRPSVKNQSDVYDKLDELRIYH